MKKLLLASLLLVGITGMAMAQTTPAKKTQRPPNLKQKQ